MSKILDQSMTLRNISFNLSNSNLRRFVLATTYIGTITGIMMITVSQYVQIMLGDNPDNPEVIFSNKLTDPW